MMMKITKIKVFLLRLKTNRKGYFEEYRFEKMSK